MKVLIVIDDLSSGGAEKLICDLSIKMKKKKDIQLEILTLSNKKNVYEEYLKGNDIKVNNLSLNQIKNPYNIILLAQYIYKNKFDIVHVNLFPAIYWVSLTSILLKKILKTRFVLTEHSTWNERRKFRFLSYIERYIYSNFDYIIAISEDVKDNLIQWLKPKNTENIVVIENGIDIEKIQSVQPSIKSIASHNKETTNVCMIGRFVESKDHKTLLFALKQTNNVHLLLAGEGPKQKEIEELAEKLNLTKKITFLGYVRDVSKVINSSAIVIQSSNWEGFGLSAVEAMAYGKPVIASNVAGLNQVVAGAGVLFENGDYNSLASEIKRLINDSKHYNDIQKKCVLRSENYNIDNTANEYRDLYFKSVD